MTIYYGVDFHAHQQTVAYYDTADGELHLSELDHERDGSGANSWRKIKRP
jgi:hypothetical protein